MLQVVLTGTNATFTDANALSSLYEADVAESLVATNPRSALAVG